MIKLLRIMLSFRMTGDFRLMILLQMVLPQPTIIFSITYLRIFQNLLSLKIRALQAILDHGVTIIAHSNGGLVAKALFKN